MAGEPRVAPMPETNRRENLFAHRSVPVSSLLDSVSLIEQDSTCLPCSFRVARLFEVLNFKRSILRQGGSTVFAAKKRNASEIEQLDASRRAR